VLYVRTPEGKERLLPHMSEGNRAKTESAPAVAVLALDTRFHEYIPEVLPFRPELKDHFDANADQRHATGTFGASLQVGYFLLAVRSLGLVTGPMAGFDKAGVDQEVFPDGRYKSLLVVNIGHPGENPWFDRLPRLAHASAVQWA
jgi:3-hydroxypropanoate dehydrogenase